MVPVVCRVCGEPMKLLDDEEQRWYCFKDDELYWAKENRWQRDKPKAVSTEPPAPPVGEFDVWIPILWLLGILILWLLGILVLGFAGGWLLGLIILTGATIYVHYDSKKFKIRGDLALLMLLFALVGLPLYAWDLHKLKQEQETPQTVQAISQPTLTSPTQPEAEHHTKFCRECGAEIPRISKFCNNCGTKQQ